ncbi:tail tube protein [uncultured Caudovirales phage]|jgi:hypothetical protein|uniref:Tail tube protein n=1 Tax=uncultured Caudovirales phage TaxID=2100421 RepID=A0A6J5T6E8_9CAUD|nr:tail tube protein [uncultured Caudovirales phage]CAB4176080.1 tail tube protein [uncultured Caudovirales phage]CAB4181511.1 tail tube protein [uncultured Caudovirales phage]CAB4189616.1 tail tube protein [uncultured Caudovirales phage]CAB4211249.1 tail tube protein [uncultured Caudovirales phage]
MAFNVQQFRSQLTGDGARPNLFQCTLTFPTLASSGGATSPGGVQDNVNLTEKFTFMARAAQLPGSTVNQIPVNYFGRELKFSGNRTFPEWTVTIINDEDFRLRNAFEKWMHGLNSHVTNTRGASFQNSLDYQQDAVVTQFGKAGNIIKQYQLVGMFPIDVSPIELDWGSNDTIEEYAVTFAYQWWESNTTETSFRNI